MAAGLGFARVAWLLAGLPFSPGGSVFFTIAIVVAAIGIGTRLAVAWIRRRAVAIRSIDRRLRVLLVVATLVPVAILLVLGSLSLQLGIASERAGFAGRALVDEGRRLDDELALALSDSARAHVRLEAFAGSPRARDLGLAVWRRAAGWTRIAGEASPDTAALESWPAPEGDVRVYVANGASYVAARRTLPGDSGAVVVALVPLRGGLAREIGRRADGELVSGGGAGDTLRMVDAVRGAVGAGVESGRRYQLSLSNGYARVGGWQWDRGNWGRVNPVVVLHVDTWKVLGALLRQTRLSWVTAVPIALMLIFVIVGLRIYLRATGLMRALGHSVTAAVGALREGAAALEAGKLEHRIAIAGEDELWEVASAFNRMAEGLERGRALELERGRIEHELALARRIQARLLPASPPQVGGVAIAGLSEPAREVGGDYYDHVVLPDGRVALVIADVSGKGVPAALLMSAFRASLLGQLEGSTDPAVVLGRLNRFLFRSIEPGRFVTAFLAVLDPASGRFEYCNAGHNPPYVVAPDGTATTLETGGLLCGMLEDGAYERGEAALAPGALLALFTDGVTEAQAAGGAMWGEDALLESLRRGGGEAPDVLARRIVAEVRRFEGDQGPSDDITLLLARRVAR